MSFPHHQYMAYSNPATPSVYGWEATSATSEQDPTLQLQQQQEPPKCQARAQQTSPSQLHVQELSASLPQPDTQVSTPQGHQVQQQQSQHQQYTTHQIIDVQPPASTPRQTRYRFETVTEEDFLRASATDDCSVSSSGSLRGASGRCGASKPPPPHADMSSAASTPGTGARVSQAWKHVQSLSAHPYRRPQSRSASGGSGAGAGASPSGEQHAPVNPRRMSDLQSAPTLVGGVSPSHTGAALFTVGTPMGVSCPASSSWREGLLGLPIAQQQTGTSFQVGDVAGGVDATPGGDASDAAHYNLVRPFTLELFKARQYGIRADIHFSAEENVIIAMFELPGVKKDDLRITMSVCPFSRVRQISVCGVSVGVLPLQGHQVRERKFGRFFRTLAVPPETKPEDISAKLEDGILTLKIPGGAPAQEAQPQDVTIPIPVPQ